jgi:predicted dehydrogenase
MSPGEPATVALVGCGAVAQLYYAPALAALEKAGWLRVAVLCDPNAATRGVLKRHFPSAREVNDPRDLLGEKTELAILASPPAVHAEQSIALLAAGMSVLCEKPLAASAAQARAMVDAAARSSGLLAAGMLRRFFPATQTIRQMVATEAIGAITSFDFQEGDVFRWPVSSGAYFQRQTAGGGVLMDIGAHALDLMIWWFGEPVEVHYEDDAMGGIEVNCRVRLRFAAGFSGVVRLSRDCALSNRYVFRGTHGSFSWMVNDANRLQVDFGNTPYMLNAAIENGGEPAAHFERSFIDQICNVIAAIRGAERLRVPAAEALPGLRLIERCYAHRSLLAMSWLEKGEAQRAAELQRLSE